MAGERVCIDGFIATSEQDVSNGHLKVPENSNDKKGNLKRPCTEKQNLVVKTNSFVTKIVFDKADGENQKPRAVGVEYTDHTKHPYIAIRRYSNPEKYDSEEAKTRDLQSYWKNEQRHDVMNCPVNENLAFNNDRMAEWYIPPQGEIPQADMQTATAKREIILSAGTVNSAQLLMLSGVGPYKHLENTLDFKKEELVMNLPGIGRLLDHEEVAVQFKLPKGVQHWGIVKDLLPETNKWVAGENSALSSNHVPGGLDISSEGINGTVPTIHIHFLMLHFENLDFNIWRKQGADYHLPAGLTDFARYEGLGSWSALIERTGTCSEGLLRLKNRDPLVTPLVDLNYGSCAFTNQEILFGIKEVRRINSLLPKEYQSEEVNPGKEFDTDEKLLNWLRSSLWGHHISGSVPMGRCDDEKAALDNHGRVYGVQGLRVADASAFPTVPHGNILYTTYVVGERIVDFIIKDNKLPEPTDSLLKKQHNA